MSAPSIPNLLSLRGSRGGGRGRNRGRGGGGGLHPPPSPSSATATAAAAGRDAVIQGTDTDAAVSRMSAVDLGYLDDPFAQFFVQRPTIGQATRRLPIINRGTYARTAALDRLISSFLSGSGGGGKRQIVSLGAGTDTRVFRLLGPQAQPPQANLIYHEIDFPAVAAKKLQLVRAVPPLRNIVPDPASVLTSEGNSDDENGTGTTTTTMTTWSSSGGSGQLPNGCEYWCHGRDLRDLARPGAKAPLKGLRTDVPTLLVSECCLCYLEAAQSRAVLDYFASDARAGIANLAVVLYEPIRPDDAFGRQMVANLAARRIRMPSLDAYGTAAAQRTRLRAAGFDGGAEARTVEEVWKEWIPDEERERVDGLEGLDEVEEWNLLAAHYVVAWGWRGSGFEGWEEGG